MDRDKFLAQFSDEMRGLLLESFRMANPPNGDGGKTERFFADQGRSMLAQMKRGQELLSRIYDSLQPKGKT
jgi:hypothetical protein